MTIDRRSFLYAGGMTAAAATPLATSAQAATGQNGRSVTDFGVVPNLGRDQTEFLQKALDATSGGQQTIIFPDGAFQARKLKVSSSCALLGQPGRTSLEIEELAIDGSVFISGISFSRLTGSGRALLAITGGEVRISHCGLSGDSETGLKVTAGIVNLHGLFVSGFRAGAVIDLDPGGGTGFVASDCHFFGCGTGIKAAITPMIISQSHFRKCGIGIVATGSGTVSGNTITDANGFGLKLGSAKGSGHILAQGNLIRDCRIGIGVSSSGDDIMASLNMITGAKDGAIRAFDGDKLVGPDLARQSAEAYLNLMVAGNVVR
jgi:hypothetical protein